MYTTLPFHHHPPLRVHPINSNITQPQEDLNLTTFIFHYLKPITKLVEFIVTQTRYSKLHLLGNLSPIIVLGHIIQPHKVFI